MSARRVRRAAMAGEWYPGNPGALTERVDSFLDTAERVVPEGRVVGLLAPHAGYPYSGQTAGWAYRQVRDEAFDTVVIVALCHGRGAWLGQVLRLETTSIYDGDAFQTPLGEVPVDRDTVTALRAAQPDLFPFIEAAHTNEHSIELQLPFLQRAVRNPKIVPILIQTTSPALVREIGAAIADAVAGRRALVVASSDLSHRPPYEVAREVDRGVLEAVVAGDPDRLRERVADLERTPAPNLMCAMCGVGATMAMIVATRRLGGRQGRLIHYSNSGDTSGMRDEVVGYGAVAFLREAPAPDACPE